MVLNQNERLIDAKRKPVLVKFIEIAIANRNHNI